MGSPAEIKSCVILFFRKSSSKGKKGKSLVLYNTNIQNGKRTIFLLPYHIQSFWKIDANRICITSRIFRSCFSRFESFKRSGFGYREKDQIHFVRRAFHSQNRDDNRLHRSSLQWHGP